jgi:hypothetical protein
VWLWPRLHERMPDGVRLTQLRLYEDDDLFVDYCGETAP